MQRNGARTPMGNARYLLGGAWNEPPYMFVDPDAQPPIVRNADAGLRLVRYTEPIPEAAASALVGLFRYFYRERPVSDEIFRAYHGLYAYDKTPVNAVVEYADDSSPYWRKEKVSFDAAYDNEKVVAYLFLPKNAAPPFQTLVFFLVPMPFGCVPAKTLHCKCLIFFCAAGGP